MLFSWSCGVGGLFFEANCRTTLGPCFLLCSLLTWKERGGRGGGRLEREQDPWSGHWPGLLFLSFAALLCICCNPCLGHEESQKEYTQLFVVCPANLTPLISPIGTGEGSRVSRAGKRSLIICNISDKITNGKEDINTFPSRLW